MRCFFQAQSWGLTKKMTGMPRRWNSSASLKWISGKSMRMASGGAALADGVLEAAEFAIDAGQMADHLGDAHDGHVFSADDAFEAGGGHARAAHAEECPLRG